MPRSSASVRACGLMTWAAKMPHHGGEVGVAVHQLEVAGELLDAVDLAATLDLDGDRGARGVLAQDVDRADGRHVLAAGQGPAVAQRRDVLGEQPLEVGLDPVLDQARVDAELVRGVVVHLVEPHAQAVLGLRVLDDPHGRDAVGGLGVVRLDLGHGAGRRHPVEGLVGPAVGVHEHGAVGLDQEQPGRERQVGGEPPVVVDAARRDHQSHGRPPYRPTGRAPAATRCQRRGSGRTLQGR